MLPCVELHFLCEHEGGIHCVETQKSNFLVLEGETLQSIWPCVILSKASGQGFVGGGFMVPNLEKVLSRARQR